MKKLRVLLIFVLFFLVAGGPAYAQSLEDKPVEGPKTKEEVQVQAPEEKQEVIQEKSVPEGKEVGEDQTKETKEEEVQENSSSDKLEDVEKKELVDQESGQATYPDSGEKERPEEKVQEEKTEDKDQKADLPKDKKEASSDSVQDQEEADQVLEKGRVLDPQALKSGGPQDQGESKVYEVKDFAGLKAAINDPDFKNKIIRITQGFEITETLTIGQGQKVILTSNNGQEMDKPWEKIDQPKDYANEGEKKQREVIEKARKRGDKAIEEAKENIKEENSDYYYDFQTGLVLKRGDKFTGTMFDVQGDLTLGDENNSINFDGNKKNVILPSGSKGHFFRVNDQAKLTLKNGIIANSKAEAGYSAAVNVEKGGLFTMLGGRISSNDTSSNATYPSSAGGVYVSIGGKFIMKNGMIDHNTGAGGAISAGDLYGAGDSVNVFESKDRVALVNLNGGCIVSNKSTGKKLAGGILIFPAATLDFQDGIVAANETDTHGGGITISDQHVSDSDNALNGSWVKTRGNYEDYVKHHKAEANFDGGLLYKNKTQRSGGGVFVDSNYVHFNRTMILDNKATLFGGGVYVSFPPRVQELKELLITENKTKSPGYVTSAHKYWGGTSVGGGIWSCPDGHVHIGDGHSVYVFNNDASKGADYCLSEKTNYFRINDKNVADKFYTFVSPVTKDKGVIKYINDDGTGEKLPPAMSYTREFVYLKAIYSKELQAEAWRNSGTFIMGNQAGYGAGIGSDTNLETPEDKGDVNFKFKKHWDASIDRDEYKNKDIKLDIYIVPEYVYDVYIKNQEGYTNKSHKIDEAYIRSQYGNSNRIYKYGEVILNRENNWQTNFSDFKNNKYTDLPAFIKDHGLPFTPQELAKYGYKYMVLERDRGYVTTIEEKYKEEKNGKIEISRDLSVDYYDIDKLGNPDYYLYYVDEFGRAHYLTKAEKEGEGIKGIFAHPMLDQKIAGIEFYGKDRNYVEEAKKYTEWIKYFEDQGDTENADYYKLLRDLKGHKSGDTGYAFFLKKDKDGLKLYVPYLFIQNWDEEGYSGFKFTPLDNSKEKVLKTYEVDVTNKPYKEAKIKKIWKMLSEDESAIEAKNRKIPDQVTFYVLKDKKKIIIDYIRDEKGRVYPVYKTVTLTKDKDWEGIIDKLDPSLLEKGIYGIKEEDLAGFKVTYELTKTKAKDHPTKLSFRLYVPDGYHLIEGYDKDDPDYRIQESTKEYFNQHFGDIKINLLIDGKVESSKVIEWKKEIMDLGEYGIRTFYSMDSDEILFGFDGEELSVYSKGRNIGVEYYNSMDNPAGATSYNIYLEKDEHGGYKMYVPNLLKKGKFYQLFQVTERERNSGYVYPPIMEFKAAPYEESIYTFLVTNTELPPERPPHEPPEEPEEPPVSPPEEPEEPPVIPPEEPEKPGEPPRKPGAPRTGMESLAPYFLLAMTSSLGLGYFAGKKD